MKKFLLAGAIALAGTCIAKAEGEEKIDSVLVGKDFSEVVVKASRINAKLKDLPNKVEVIKVHPLKAATASDVGQLIMLNSGVDVIQYPGKLSSIGLRGFQPDAHSSKYSMLLINGLPAGTQNISTLDLSMAEQVEIMKGPFSSLYGSSAMGGVINITTPRTTSDLRGTATLKAGSFDLYGGSANVGGSITDNWNFDLNIYGEEQGSDYKMGERNLLSLSEYEKAILHKESRGQVYENTKYKQFGANARVGYNFNENWFVDINSGFYSSKDINSPGSIFGSWSGASKKDLQRTNFNIETEGKAGRHLLRLSPYYSVDNTEYYNSLEDDAYVNYKKVFFNYGFQLQDKIDLGQHSLVVGADYKVQSFETQRWGEKDGNISEIAPYMPYYKDKALGVFVQTHFRFLDERLNISTGGRFDHIQLELEKSDLIVSKSGSESHTVFNPNVGAKFEIIKGLNAHTSLGTAFFSPDAFQKAGYYEGWYKIEGNPELAPEKSVTFDLGLGYSNYALGIDFDATYFQSKHDDLIIQEWKDKDANIKSYYNANEANMNGLEVMASYDFGSLYDYAFSLKAYANLTFMFNADMKMDEGGVEEEITCIREQSGNFGIQFLYEKLSFRFNGRYMGSRIEKDWNSGKRPELPALAEKAEPGYWAKGLLKHPDHLVFDSSVFYEANETVTFGVSVGNLFDEHYAEKDAYHSPGRNFLAKCIVKF